MMPHLKSIGKILKNDKTSKITENDKKSIVASIYTLCYSHIRIEDTSGQYEGNLIDGELETIDDKICIHIKSKPILLDFAENNGRNYLATIPLKELRLNTTCNTERIAIFRYLLDRLRVLYGSYINDDKQRDVRSGYTNSTPLSHIINAIYPDGFEKHYKDKNSKKRNILESVKAVCEAMAEDERFITGYEIVKNPNGEETIVFSREPKAEGEKK